MVLRTLGHLGIGAAITLTVLLGIAVPKVVSAGEYKCEDRFLDEVDEMRLRRAALKVLPKSAHLDEVGPCRNPRNARAFISTRKTIAADGASHWWQFTCRRDAWYWHCDSPESKQAFQTQWVVDGTSHDVDLAFDREISLSRALRLADVSLKLYQNPKAKLVSCGSRSAESDWESARPQSQMPADRISIQISVNEERTTQTVWLHDVGIAIDFAIPTNEEAEPAASCWGNEVIVT